MRARSASAFLHIHAQSAHAESFKITKEDTTMNRRHTTLSLSVITALGLAMLMGNAVAQQKSLQQQLVGTWNLVSVDQTDAQGKKHQLFGPDPKGSQVLDASGQYVQIIWRSDVPKFKANSRLKGTAEENAATIQGTTANFGTWTVDEASKTLTVRYVGSLFPNQAGSDSKRIVSVTGDELRVSNPATGSGMRSDTVWRRAKSVATN
jgi:Lipocalin-like domain